jgi:raffinose/stachyose/melibiose transport system substrate-binding protein
MPRTVSRKDFLRLAGAVLLGTAGCSGRRGKVVKFLAETPETTVLERAAEEIIARFEEQHPSIDIQREAMPTEDVRAVIEARLRSHQRPDVFTYDTGPGFGGVPDQVQEIVVYYNKDLVPEEPKTVDELRRIADGLKGRGIIPLAFGNLEQWPAGHMFSIGVSNVLGREGLVDIFYEDGRWDTPEVVKPIDLFFRDFVESGYYPESVNGVAYDGANTLFYSANAAMLPTGTWLVPEIVEAIQDFEVGFFPFPSIDGSSISPPAGLGSGLFVAKNAKNPEGAITFIDYLLQDDTARLIVEKTNIIPAHPVNMEGLDVPDLFKQVLEDLSQSPQVESFGYNIDVLAPQNFNEVMFTGFQEVINGSRSPEEQAAALQAAWEKAKKQGDVPTQE